MLRERGLLKMLTSLEWRVEDVGDFDFESLVHSRTTTGIAPNDTSGSTATQYFAVSNAKNCRIVGEGNRLLADKVEETVREGRFPLVLGGDHSIGLGSLAGLLRVRPHTGVIWIDAHADLNTPDTSESGNMHGMPLGLIMNGIAPDHNRLSGLEWLVDGPRLSTDSLVYVGLRDVDAGERQFIRQHNIKAFTMHEIDRYGIGRVMEEALGHLLQNDAHRPLHISYDIDAVDPVLAPATGTAVRGGLTFREAHYVAEAVAASGNLGSADIVELNPTLSDGAGANETVELGLQLVTSMLGKSII